MTVQVPVKTLRWAVLAGTVECLDRIQTGGPRKGGWWSLGDKRCRQLPQPHWSASIRRHCGSRGTRLETRSGGHIFPCPLTMAFVVDFLIVVVALAVSLLITVPIIGGLVRLRANYNPKGLQLDEEGVVHPYTGPQLTSFLGMLTRVKRLEVRPLQSLTSDVLIHPLSLQGWPGLYKGLSERPIRISIAVR